MFNFFKKKKKEVVEPKSEPLTRFDQFFPEIDVTKVDKVIARFYGANETLLFTKEFTGDYSFGEWCMKYDNALSNLKAYLNKSNQLGLYQVDGDFYNVNTVVSIFTEEIPIETKS